MMHNAVNLNSHDTEVAADEAERGRSDVEGWAVLDLVRGVAISVTLWALDLSQHRAECSSFGVLHSVVVVDDRKFAVSFAEITELKVELTETGQQRQGQLTFWFSGAKTLCAGVTISLAAFISGSFLILFTGWFSWSFSSFRFNLRDSIGVAFQWNEG